MGRSVTVDLRDGDEELTIVLRGKECRVADLQMTLVAFLREQSRKQATRTDPPKPCGCGTSANDQRPSTV